MSNPFSAVKNFFVSVFSNVDSIVSKVVSGVKIFIKDAAPIVSALQQIDKKLPASTFATEVGNVLSVYVKDASSVSSFISGVTGFSPNQILKAAAILALQALQPNVSENYLSIAIELALAVLQFKAA